MNREIHTIGSKTREWVISSQACPTLWPFRISLCGISQARAPYRMERSSAVFSEMVFPISGKGKVLVDGGWQMITPGHTYLAPQGVPHGFYAAQKSTWRFVWFHLRQNADRTYFKSTTPCILTSTNNNYLEKLVSLLYQELNGVQQQDALGHYAELISIYLRRNGTQNTPLEPLGQLWQDVDSAPGEAWTLSRLGMRAGMSTEHLRRICLKYRGRSPMAHVTEIRMQRAAIRLKSGMDKIESIARDVGYGSLYAFSAVFKRWSGYAPSAYRKKHFLYESAKNDESSN